MDSGQQRSRAPERHSLFVADKRDYQARVLTNGVHPHEVGLKQANAYGLRDILGNVGEWTRDWMAPDGYAESPDEDPTGPESGAARVLRGGHFLYPPMLSRATKRLWNEPEARSPIVGFRPVLARMP